MCAHGTTVEVKLSQPRESGRFKIPVDSCIAREIQYLNDIGVITHGCCCGHGRFEAQCLVDISSKELLESEGYQLREFSKDHTESGIFEILLRLK